jgi:hypothetical protein
MKISLKKIKVYESLSEETTAFTADLYINGKHVGEVSNDGHGGQTMCMGFNKISNEIIWEAERIFSEMPKKKEVLGGREYEFQRSLDGAVNELVYQYSIEKQNKKIQKLCDKWIVYGDKGGMYYTQVGYKGISIQTLLDSGSRDSLKKLYDETKGKLKVNEVIFNTNLPTEWAE